MYLIKRHLKTEEKNWVKIFASCKSMVQVATKTLSVTANIQQQDTNIQTKKSNKNNWYEERKKSNSISLNIKQVHFDGVPSLPLERLFPKP